MNFSKYPKHSDGESKLTDQEFDRFLLEVDDFTGDAPGVVVPPDFLPRVVELARLESLSAGKPWSVLTWYYDLSLTMRLTMASAVLLACLGGVRAGQAVTDVIARRAKQPVEFADPLGLAVPEQAIVQLVHNDGLAIQGQLNKSSGEQQ